MSSQKTKRHFLIESNDNVLQEHLRGNGMLYTFCPVECRRVEERGWLSAPDTQRRVIDYGMYRHLVVRVHGRQVGDEVELFAMEDGQPTLGMKEQLVAKGYTVRLFDDSLTPSTASEAFFASLKQLIADWEIANDIPVRHALLVDAGRRSPQETSHRIAVVLLSEEKFTDFLQSKHQSYSHGMKTCRVIGGYHMCELKRVIKNKDLMMLFGYGGEHPEPLFWDDRLTPVADEEGGSEVNVVFDTELARAQKKKERTKAHKARKKAKKAAAEVEAGDDLGLQPESGAKNDVRKNDLPGLTPDNIELVEKVIQALEDGARPVSIAENVSGDQNPDLRVIHVTDQQGVPRVAEIIRQAQGQVIIASSIADGS